MFNHSLVFRLVIVALFFVGGFTPTKAKSSETRPQPTIQDLGNQVYRVGHIEVDRAEQRFSVPGNVVALPNPDAPLEYLAVARGGLKAYESLFELDTTAIDFNLACILIGLDRERSSTPEYQFDPEPALGDSVMLWVRWKQNGEMVQKRVTEFLKFPDDYDRGRLDDWVYTGSQFSGESGEEFMAATTGTLIGFVHDPIAIIEHKHGLGIGAYGAVTANDPVLQALDIPFSFIVERVPHDRPAETPGE